MNSSSISFDIIISGIEDYNKDSIIEEIKKLDFISTLWNPYEKSISTKFDTDDSKYFFDIVERLDKLSIKYKLKISLKSNKDVVINF